MKIRFSLFALLFLVTTTTTATHQPTNNALLQYTSAGHALGFHEKGFYVASNDHMLRIDFVDSRPTSPYVPDKSSSNSYDDSSLTKVTYHNLWSDISVSYTTDSGGIFESTWQIASGGNPEQIRLRYNIPTEITAEGQLKMRYTRGWMQESAPVAWQMDEGQRLPVDVAFNRYDDGSIGFKLGDYDKSLPLLIDPVLEWNTFLGSSGGDDATSIATDASGNIYITGSSQYSWGNPIVAHTGGGGSYDGFLAKLSPTGELLWNTFMGSSNVWDNANSVAVDSTGNIYVTGDSPATWGSPVNAHSGGGTNDAFIVKFNASGTRLWNTFIGLSTHNYFGNSIAVDANNNSYIAGTQGQSGSSTYKKYAFASKINATGTPQWTTSMGASTQDDKGEGIALDAAGNVYVGGSSRITWGSPINPYTGTFDNAFVAKLNNAGTLQWNTFVGSASWTLGYAITANSAGDTFLTGYGGASWGTPVNAHAGGDDGFVIKLNTNGAAQWHTFFGSSSTDRGAAITMDSGGNLYVAGTSWAAWGTPENAYAGGGEAFAVKLDAAGAISWNTFLGSVSEDAGKGISVDSANNVYLTGNSSVNWGWPVRAFLPNDVFAAKVCDSCFTVSTSAPPTQGSFTPGVRAVLGGNTTTFTVNTQPGYSIATVSGCGGNWTGTNPYTTGAISADCTVTATFTLNSYSVTPSAGANGSISPDTPQTVDHGNTVQFTVTPATNYEASVGGSCGGSLAGNIYTTNAITGNCTVQASFSLITYTVDTAAPAAQGSFSPSSRTVDHGSNTTFDVSANTGYSINTVSGCGGTWTGSNPYTTGIITADCTVTATFTPDSYAVTASVDAHGTLDNTAVSVDYGTTTSFTVTPDPGFTTNLTVGGSCPVGSWSGQTYTTGIIVGPCNVSFTHAVTTFSVTPSPRSHAALIAAGGEHSLALRGNTTVVGWGDDWSGQSTPPAGLSDVVAVAAGGYQSLGLKTDGTVVAWGDDGDGQASVPAGLSDVIAIAAGYSHSLAVRADGSVVAWGNDGDGQSTVPSTLQSVIAVAGGSDHSLALKSDGTVVGWGYDYDGQATPPAGLNGVIAISSGSWANHSLALKNDGTVVAWGDNSSGQTDVPPGLSGVVAIAAGGEHSLALKADGSVVGWGYDYNGQATPPAGLSNVVAIAAGGDHSLALKNDGSIIGWGNDGSGQATPPLELNMLPLNGRHGSITPNNPTRVDAETTVQFSVTADPGYTFDENVGGTCTAGSWSGNIYTSGSTTTNCTVDFNFIADNYTVTAAASAGGIATPASQAAIYGDKVSFTVTSDIDHVLSDAISGSCPLGSWGGKNGDLYTTGSISGSCYVNFHFVNNIQCIANSGLINIASKVYSNGEEMGCQSNAGELIVFGPGNTLESGSFVSLGSGNVIELGTGLSVANGAILKVNHTQVAPRP